MNLKEMYISIKYLGKGLGTYLAKDSKQEEIFLRLK